MKRILLPYLLIISSLYHTIVFTHEIPEDFVELECKVKLRVRPFEQEEPTIRSGDLVPYTHPLIPLKKGVSNNWCGYVAAKNLASAVSNSVTAVSGSWIVPNVLAPSLAYFSDTYSSLWIGIDGYNNGTVEQIGTAHEWHNGKPYHYAWFEMYPNAAFEIQGFPVVPGDTISARIEYKGNNIFLMTIANTTRKVYTTIPTAYTTSVSAIRACAEWVAEAPYMKSVLPLAHFSAVSFTKCTVTIGGTTGGINNPNWKSDNIAMKNAIMLPKAVASPLQDNGQGFNVTWLHE
ncbi:MAG: hypothetical protein K2X90_02835 [Candidatus Babeliaceae bacterium]|nr:hypothetical protein [Candidatus Babeliaceae bacterium]